MSRKNRRIRRAGTVLLLTLLAAGTVGCAAETEDQPVQQAAVGETEESGDTAETETKNWFSEPRVSIPMGIYEDGEIREVLTADIPESLFVTQVNTKEAEGNDSYNIIPFDYKTTAKEAVEQGLLDNLSEPIQAIISIAMDTEGTGFYYFLHNEGTTNLDFIENACKGKGKEFEHDGYRCFMLGPDDGYNSGRGGDVSVYIELVPGGAYLEASYSGILTDTETDEQITERLMELITLE